MKKKFINGLLLVALFVGFTGSMVSCKDYDDEKLGNVEASLRDALEAQKTTLQNQINNLQTQLTTCQNTCKEFRESIAKTLEDYLTVKKFQEFQNSVYTKEEIDAKLKDLADQLKNQLDKEAVVETIVELLQSGNNSLTTAFDNYFVNSAAVQEFFKTGKGADIVKELIQGELADALDKAGANADKALELAQKNELRIDGLEDSVEDLEDAVGTLTIQVLGLGEEIAEIREIAAKAQAAADANTILIQKLQDNYETLKQTVADNYDVLFALISNAQDDLEALADLVALDQELAEQLHKEMLETISGLVDDVDGLKDALVEIAQVIEEHSSQLEKLAGFFQNTLAKWITGIEINGTYNPLFGEFAFPFDVRSNVLVAFHGKLDDYGIEFPTRRPSRFALPDQASVITAADYQMLGDFEVFTLAGNQNIIAGQQDDQGTVTEGNAGTLYLTVNPTNRDFTGTEFTLINSQNEEAVVTLSDLQKSDHTLYFGYTRAGSDNGFYEAKATFHVDNFDQSNRLNFDLAGVKEVARDIKNFRSGINLTNLATTVYNNFSKVLEANAVKATWTDDYETKSVVSQYSIAATSIKPLSFGFAKDISYDHIPGLGRVESYIDRLLEKVDFALPEMKEVSLTINHIDIPEFDEDNVKWTIHFTEDLGTKQGAADADVTVTLPELSYTDENGLKHDIDADGDASGSAHVVVDVEVGTIEITYSIADMIKEVYGDITEPMSKVNEMLDQINDFVDDINEYLAKLNDISVDGIKDRLTEQLSDYIDALNKRFARYFGTPNKYLQPLLLVRSAGSFARLSEAETYPARVKGTTIQLVPTTFNAEVLAPAFKKFVAVTNVIKGGTSAKAGDATCKAILDRANAQENVKQVIDGGFGEKITFKGEAGYTYEILYTAVDYSGAVAAKKYYVAF